MCSLKSFHNTFFLFCVLTWGVIDVNARFAKIEDYPFQVSVEHNEVPTCGGAIIGDYWVITAASCVPEDYEEVKNLRIRAGSQKLGTGGALHTAAKMVRFSGSYFAQAKMDIGLIKVEVPFMYATNIQWSEPAIEFLEQNTDIKLSGWGLGESHHGGEGKVLRDATVQVLPDNECREKFEGKLNITKAMACLVPAGEYDNACLGDVGSPIVVTGLISAVVSNNDYCWENDYPTVVTNIGNAGFFLAYVMSEPIIRNFSANAFPGNEF